MHDKYLPIGTIILLKDNISMYMIVGYFNEKKDNANDYICVPFPYGLMAVDVLKNCKHDDIDSILFFGYKNDKYIEMNEKMKRIDLNEKF